MTTEQPKTDTGHIPQSEASQKWDLDGDGGKCGSPALLPLCLHHMGYGVYILISDIFISHIPLPPD